jgi:hypothetical protein
MEIRNQAHWGSESYPDRARGDMYVQAIKKPAKKPAKK